MGPRIAADDDDDAQPKARPRSLSEHASAAVSRKVDAILAPWKRAAGYLLALVLGGGAGSVATGLVEQSAEPARAEQTRPSPAPAEQADCKCASSRDVRHALDWLLAITTGLRAAGIVIVDPQPTTIPAAFQPKPDE